MARPVSLVELEGQALSEVLALSEAPEAPEVLPPPEVLLVLVQELLPHLRMFTPREMLQPTEELRGLEVQEVQVARQLQRLLPEQLPLEETAAPEAPEPLLTLVGLLATTRILSLMHTHLVLLSQLLRLAQTEERREPLVMDLPAAQVTRGRLARPVAPVARARRHMAEVLPDRTLQILQTPTYKRAR